jgi:hypothetical protein
MLVDACCPSRTGAARREVNGRILDSARTLRNRSVRLIRQTFRINALIRKRYAGDDASPFAMRGRTITLITRTCDAGARRRPFARACACLQHASDPAWVRSTRSAARAAADLRARVIASPDAANGRDSHASSKRFAVARTGSQGGIDRSRRVPNDDTQDRASSDWTAKPGPYLSTTVPARAPRRQRCAGRG